MLFSYQNTSYFGESFAFEQGSQNAYPPFPAMLLACGHNEAAHYPGYLCEGLHPANQPSIVWQYTLSGEGVLEYEDGPAIHLHPEDLMLVFAPHNYRYYPTEADQSWEFLFICMNGDLAIETVRCLNAHHGPVNRVSKESGAVSAAREILAQTNQKLITSQWTASKLAFDLIMETARDLTASSEQLRPEFIRKAFEYCASHADGPLSVGDLARAAGYSQFHFVRQFKKHVGVSPSDYIREVRLSRAHKLLQMTMASTKEIADACGFVSVSHFSRAFRTRYGMPPGKLRKDYRASRKS